MFHLPIHSILTFMKETTVKSRFSDIKFSDNLQFSAIYFAEYNFSIYYQKSGVMCAVQI